MNSTTASCAFLGLGTNLGTDDEKLAVLRGAVDALQADSAGALRIVKTSSVYRTPPWGVADQPDFFNAVVQVETTLPPRELLALAKQTEQNLGRTPTYRWGPRVLDIDILLMDGLILDEKTLTIPHPRMLDRAFVLVPLLEIAPDASWPEGRPIAQIATVDPGEMIVVGELRRE